ncbi:hypothetical protein BDD14_2614 [Edaphobacter modestus]|uniref:Uncharacterized protein n=1 Tax=Edaphobacter modestus TaxID=388466 RepID=A0A4V2G4I9_9BACT|nr:hypothetical protein BDD14_2614 [Edaphobacter modestus]
MGKKKRYSATFIVAAQLGILAGIILAFYLVPGSTSAKLLWAVSGLFFVMINSWLFLRNNSN